MASWHRTHALREHVIHLCGDDARPPRSVILADGELRDAGTAATGAVQSGLSVIPLVAAGAFIRSLQTATSIAVGFDADRVPP